MTDYSQAFGAKADIYAQHRWDYAPEAIDHALHHPAEVQKVMLQVGSAA